MKNQNVNKPEKRKIIYLFIYLFTIARTGTVARKNEKS